MSPTARSLAHLKQLGYQAVLVVLLIGLIPFRARAHVNFVDVLNEITECGLMFRI